MCRGIAEGGMAYWRGIHLITLCRGRWSSIWSDSDIASIGIGNLRFVQGAFQGFFLVPDDEAWK